MSDLPTAVTREAFCSAAAALDAAERGAQPFEMTQALTRVARCYRGVGALGPAESGLEMALRWARLTGSTDLCVDLLAELAETATSLAGALAGEDAGAARAALESARDHVFEASTRVPGLSDPSCQPQALLRLSDVLDRCGDHDDACELQTRALRLLGGHRASADPARMPSLGRLADG
jgi:tetratricopeptide (TPR) repeat protein